jgi:hypothetical protein
MITNKKVICLKTHSVQKLPHHLLIHDFFLLLLVCITVLRILIRKFLGLIDPSPDPVVRGTDPAPDPSIIKQK